MRKTKLLLILTIYILLSNILHAQELKKVTLQLSWFNQFQFAGYFIAKEKGYYEKLGLDVEIKPFKFGLDIPKLVNDSKIDFAIDRETLLLQKGKNKNIVALYALFQATPLVLLSTNDSGINEISDFKNKRLMTTIDDASEVSLKAMITSNKIDIKSLKFLSHTHNINDLINKRTDIISGYISKSPYELKKKNIKYNVFDPKEFGFDLYSDFLFTNKKLIDSDPQTVKAFRKASLEGWSYAYTNIEETAKLIQSKYNTQHLSLEELVYEGEELRKLSYFKNKELGSIRKEKVLRIHDLYNILGLVSEPIDIDSFLYTNYEKDDSSLKLSSSRKEYIKNNPIVNMCIVPDIRPYSFIKDGKISGFAIDYFNLIEKRTGLTFNLVKTNSLAQSVDFLKQKKCDVLSSASKTKERESFANFTSPFINVPFVLITNAKNTFIDDISLLRNRKVSLVKSYASSNKIKELYPNINFTYVDSLDEGLSKVANEENFGHIDLLYTSWYKIHINDFDKLRVSSKLDFTLPISIAIRNDYYELYEILNLAVLSISTSQVDEILQKWINVVYKKQTDYTLLWQLLIVVLIVFLAVTYRQRVLKEANNLLQIKVEEKNKELMKINEELEDRIKIAVEENLKKDRILSQQSKMIAMGQMIENIAHQWRQPLSLISTIASGLKIKNDANILDTKDASESLSSIVKTSKYLSNTIDDFRYFFEPEKEKNEFLLSACCNKAIELVSSSFKQKGIDVNLIVEDDVRVCGYERGLIQVLINILNNSKDAFTIQIEERVIFIDVIRLKNKAIIEIKDNALGIEESILEKIYEPYFTTKHKSQGTGIGLYMCQEIIVKHMDGRIQTKNVNFTYNNKSQKGALTSIVLDAI